MDVSIIIVNWNSFKLLCDCLRSIYKTQPKISFEIIVVDNCSLERDIEDLNKYFSNVKLILLNRNEGFACANNLAAKQANGKILLFLNPDTIVKNNAIDGMYRKLNNSENIGAIGPKITNPDDSIQQDAARRLPTLFSTFCNIFLLKRAFSNVSIFSEYIKNYNRSQEVEFISGACIGIRASLFFRIDGFSEDYFMYSEDADLCYRIRKLGFKNYYNASSEIIHIGGSSSKKVNNVKLFECWFFKSRRIYFKKIDLFSFASINMLYAIGGIYRVCLSFLMLIFSILFSRNVHPAEYCKLTVLKYFKIFLLGISIDTIGK
jgi:hypothetical protein